jgi:hypothetical protein
VTVVQRLPKDFMMETTACGHSIKLSMTLRTIDEARALATAIDLAIIPILGLVPNRKSDASDFVPIGA